MTFGQDARMQTESSARSTPGPGQYGSKPVDRTPRWGFGASQRAQSADPSAKLSPGPGSYDPEGSLATIAALASGRRPASRGPSMTPRRPYKHERPDHGRLRVGADAVWYLTRDGYLQRPGGGTLPVLR